MLPEREILALHRAITAIRSVSGEEAELADFMADLLARSYAALRIPQDHIRVFNEDLPAGLQSGPQFANPFHGQGLFNPAYAEQRTFFLRGPER